MNKTVIGLIVAIALFSVSAGVSWFLQPPAAPDTSKQTDKDNFANGTLHHGVETPKDKPVDEARSTRPTIRPGQAPDAEYLTKLAADLESQSDGLRRREQGVTNRQKNIDLVYKEILKEQRNVDGIRKQIDEEMKLLAEKADAIERKYTETKLQGSKLDEQNKDLRQTLLEVEDAERVRVKQMANFYDTMEAEKAAPTFQEMIDSGKLDMAVKILSNMKDRSASKLLAQLPNQTLAVQLLDRLKGLKPPPAKKD
jgi:flagellar motility protein MotE (MotC chaperone)